MQGIPGYGEHQEHAGAYKALFGLSMVSFCARASPAWFTHRGDRPSVPVDRGSVSLGSH